MWFGGRIGYRLDRKACQDCIVIIVIVVMVIMTLNANQEVLAHPLGYHVIRVQRSAVVKGMWHLSVARLKKSESDSESD